MVKTDNASFVAGIIVPVFNRWFFAVSFQPFWHVYHRYFRVKLFSLLQFTMNQIDTNDVICFNVESLKMELRHAWNCMNETGVSTSDFGLDGVDSTWHRRRKDSTSVFRSETTQNNGSHKFGTFNKHFLQFQFNMKWTAKRNSQCCMVHVVAAKFTCLNFGVF